MEQAIATRITAEEVKARMDRGEPLQGHLHYQVDDGPVIATTTTKLSFHNLTAGSHKIMVVLANNDHTSTGVEQTLEVKIP